MNTEDGPQSSEEGSALHSPVFGAAFPSPHGGSCELLLYCLLQLLFSPNKVRYQHDQLEAQRAAALLVPPYEYGTALNVQQPPLLDTTLELPNASSQHVSFSTHFPLAPRNHLPHDYTVQQLPNPRLTPPGNSNGMDYRYNASSDRRLPGGHSHDHSYSRPATGNNTVHTDGDRRPHPGSSSDIKEASTSTLTNGSRQARKEVSTTVIACRQWYVLFGSASIAPLMTQY
jgi:hypothetical protein